VELVEAVADGRASELLLPDAWEKARTANGRFIIPHTYACALTACIIQDNIGLILSHAASATGSQLSENREQARLVRDIFGNPFRPVSFSQEWRTDTAVSLARTMYDSRDFSAMPILADALQDAGCDSEDILSHCRDAEQAHVRGCWVVDRVLGKA
jgi:hypothetical protein